MANTAAFLVDRVLPDVPLRQYVLTLPYELRKLVAFKAGVLTAVARIFVESVFAGYRTREAATSRYPPRVPGHLEVRPEHPPRFARVANATADEPHRGAPAAASHASMACREAAKVPP